MFLWRLADLGQAHGPTTAPFFLTLLGFIYVPVLIRNGGRSAGTSCQSNLRYIGKACEMDATDNGGHYPPRLGLLTPNYLRTMPTCSSVGKDTYSGSYLSASKPADAYTLFCEGNNHKLYNEPPNYPQYNSTQGLVR